LREERCDHIRHVDENLCRPRNGQESLRVDVRASDEQERSSARLEGSNDGSRFQ
jgi:hypothetical protein